MVPPLGQFGFPRPSAHWDLALPGVLSNLCLSQGFPRAFRGGAGRRPAALALARGGTGAALGRCPGTCPPAVTMSPLRPPRRRVRFIVALSCPRAPSPFRIHAFAHSISSGCASKYSPPIAFTFQQRFAKSCSDSVPRRRFP